MEPTQQQPTAIWNTARDVWEVPNTEGLFCEHLAVFSETFTTSGMTVNGVAYGLTGYVWTNDLTRALRFSENLDAGMIWVNSENVRHLPTPFGGVKASGIGRAGGQWSFEFYMETKNTASALGQHKIQRLGA